VIDAASLPDDARARAARRQALAAARAKVDAAQLALEGAQELRDQVVVRELADRRLWPDEVASLTKLSSRHPDELGPPRHTLQ
jgi:hypothetical protein